MTEPLNLKEIERHIKSGWTTPNAANDMTALLRALRETRTALQSIATACEMCGAFGYPTYSDLEARARTVLGEVRDE